MKLLVYDKFWDALINLPKNTQKKVNSFQKKFRENSKSSAIHLEPISTFKDSSLRSARIDQEYRAIIKAPESGDVYYLLWVDHHDEAYRWATNKVFQWNDVTQSVQMFTIPDEGIQQEQVESKQSEKADYTKQEAFMSTFPTDKLIKLGVPEVLLPSIAEIDTLSDLEGMEQFIPTDVFEHLFYILEGANIDELIYEISLGLSSDSTDDKENSINNQRSFIELTDDSLFNEALTGSLNKWKYYLHPSQQKLVKGSYKGTVKVSGGAGTGKTVAALHRLKYLVESKQQQEQILFTTYTNALTENLTHLIKELEIDTSNLTVTNIDKLVTSLIQDYQLVSEGFKVFEFDGTKDSLEFWDEVISSNLTSFSPDFLEAEFKDVVLLNNIQDFEDYLKVPRKGRGKPISRRQRKEIWSLFDSFNSYRSSKNVYYRDELFNRLTNHLVENEIRPYDYCLVDELQDFSNVELRLVRRLVEVKENDLFLVGDPLQTIYDRKINFSKVGINVRGKKSQRLRINYRTTEEIKRLAVSIIEDCHYDNFAGEEEQKSGYVSLFHGEKPTYELFKSTDEEVKNVLDKILELTQDKYTYSDIAICSRTKNGLKEFRNILHKNEISYDEKGSDKTQQSNAVSLLTFHKIKGLEFKHVFIVDVNSRSVPKIPFNFEEYSSEEKETYLRNEKSMMYVACSRAIQNVCISGVGRKSEFVKL